MYSKIIFRLHRCENIIKMIRATFWVLVFAKTQKGSFIKSTKTQKPHT
jgi:hypothetical protein